MLNDYDEFSTDVYDESNWPYNHAEIGNVEIGAAVRKVIKKARDNRMPAPKMRAVPVGDTSQGVYLEPRNDWSLTDVFIGVAEVTGNPDPFPMTSALMLRFGAGNEAGRVVRVDTEDSYKAFRADQSPEMAKLQASVADLQQRLLDHESDPNAHGLTIDQVEELTLIGEEVDAAEDAKRITLYMPAHFDGLLEAWDGGDCICASIALPGADGKARIATSVEPKDKAIAEMARHAAEADVPGPAIVGMIPHMGCVLGAATAIKEMAAAAPSILAQPQAQGQAPFVVRIEPKASPALCALAALAVQCQNGNVQACTEWEALRSAAGNGPVAQAMGEAMALIKRV